MQAMFKYLQLIADVNDKGTGMGFYGDPLAIVKDLKTGNVTVLKKNGESIGIGVCWETIS